MSSILHNFLSVFQLGPHYHWKKVEEYLDNATQDSVLSDLQTALLPRTRQIQHLQTLFDASCIKNKESQEYHWTQDSLQKHIEKAHPDANFSESEIALLWRCLYFYAYHPFPTSSETVSKIDQDAFERAVTLLAAQGTDLLGALEEGDYFWRFDKDAAFFHIASFDRVFRSASYPYHGYSCSSAFLVADVMDVLAMTQPQDVNFAPSANQLEPAARKLLDEGSTRRCRCRVATEDLSMFLSILLRMKLDKAKWGLGFHFGGFDKANPENEKLARIMVEDTGLPMGFHPSKIDMLPNLPLRFHQLWAVLFQPPKTANDQVLKTSKTSLEEIPTRILRAISLFIPQQQIPIRSQTASADMRIALDPITQGSDNMRASLFKLLIKTSYPFLMLFTGDDITSSTSETVFGAWFDPKAVSHIIFQLQPQFHLIQWNGAQPSHLMELISMGNGDPWSSDGAYRIGHPGGQKTGLQVDPESQTATLKYCLSEGYRDGSGEGAKNLNVSVRACRLSVFRVLGRV